jgi:Subtilase family/Fn3-like domain
VNPFPQISGLKVFVTATSPADLADDACNPLPPGTPDLSQYLVLTRRGTCLLSDKLTNLENAGAKFILYRPSWDTVLTFSIQNIPTSVILPPPVTSNSIRTSISFIRSLISDAMISFSDGELLRRSNGSLTVDFPSDPGASFITNLQTGGFLSTFTSWGPSNEVNINPQIAAPGGAIYSTWPLALGGFNIISGTSMATPYITGVVALFLASKGPADPVKVRGLLGTTGNPIDWNDGQATTVGLKAPVVQQGGGLVNALRFVKATTVIEPGFLELNVLSHIEMLILQDTARFQGTHNILLTNTGTDTVTYNLGFIHAATTYVFNSSLQIAPFPPTVDTSPVVDIEISTTAFSLDPGTSTNITVQFTPQQVNPLLLPIYSGYITVASTASGDNGSLHIPFLGAAFNSTALPIYDPNNSPQFTGVTRDTTITSDGTVFSMSSTTNDFPQINFRLLFGTRILRMDVLPGIHTVTTGTTPFAGLNILAYFSVVKGG